MAALLSGEEVGAPRRSVLLTDLSLDGVGFRNDRPLEVGVRLRIDIGNGPLTLTGHLRIANCRELHDGTYQIGAEFV